MQLTPTALPDPDTGYWLIVLYLAALGGAVGSFMNVVVYRLPNGLSVISPPSHCPMCKTPIRWFDNVPVFGWLMLRGRCRSCRCWIPFRYPAIEATVAVIFGSLAAVEYPWHVVYWYHAMLLCTLLCLALIQFDGYRAPLRLFVPAFAVGIWLPLLYVLLVRFAPSASKYAELPWILAPYSRQSSWDKSLIRGAIGLASGLGVGGLLWLIEFAWRKIATKGEPAVKPSFGLALGLACLGLFLGWEALWRIGVTATALAAILATPRYVWPRLRLPCSVPLFVATFAWMLVWILFHERLVWPFGWW
jgi:prepilin signal peptidase PulO-like enzyme (type II secretory pathway)